MRQKTTPETTWCILAWLGQSSAATAWQQRTGERRTVLSHRWWSKIENRKKIPSLVFVAISSPTLWVQKHLKPIKTKSTAVRRQNVFCWTFEKYLGNTVTLERAQYLSRTNFVLIMLEQMGLTSVQPNWDGMSSSKSLRLLKMICLETKLCSMGLTKGWERGY